MVKIFILVLFQSNGESIQIAAYDDNKDCDEVSWQLNYELDKSKGAYSQCVMEGITF